MHFITSNLQMGQLRVWTVCGWLTGLAVPLDKLSVKLASTQENKKG